MLIRDKENSWSIDLNGKQFGARLAMGQPSVSPSLGARPADALSGVCRRGFVGQHSKHASEELVN